MSSKSQHQALILVIERDPHVRALETFFLQDAGYGVEFTEDGETALARAREKHPRIVITEILVPKLDGLALCRTLKQDPATSDIAVVIFSILMAEDRAREAGADAFLRKPLIETQLIETVRALLATRGDHERLHHA
jgi:two-component system response regulator MprA